MVLSEKAMRAWKLASGVSTAVVSWYVLFEVDYTQTPHNKAYCRKNGREAEDDPHVLASLQQWYRRAKNRMILGVDVPPPPPRPGTIERQPQQEQSEEKQRPSR